MTDLWPLTEANDGRCRCGKPAYAISDRCEWHPAVRLHRLTRLRAADLSLSLPDAFLRLELRHLDESIEGSPELRWARWYDRRCAARVEVNPSGLYGRCELRAGHPGDHALERGTDRPRWSTGWTG